MNSSVRRGWMVMLPILCGAHAATAQPELGTITGTVKDPRAAC